MYMFFYVGCRYVYMFLASGIYICCYFYTYVYVVMYMLYVYTYVCIYAYYVNVIMFIVLYMCVMFICVCMVACSVEAGLWPHVLVWWRAPWKLGFGLMYSCHLHYVQCVCVIVFVCVCDVYMCIYLHTSSFDVANKM